MNWPAIITGYLITIGVVLTIITSIIAANTVPTKKVETKSEKFEGGVEQ